MLLTLDKTRDLIGKGRPLHISGSGELLEKLPRGNWIGGSTEYFMAEGGGIVTGRELFVNELDFTEFKISEYDEKSIDKIAMDGYETGFTVVIMPFDSGVHKFYAEEAPAFEGMFLRNVIGWVSGTNQDKPGQKPVTVNGKTGAVYTDKAVAMHIRAPQGKTVSLGIVNIFSEREDSPVIEFEEEGFSVTHCLIDGKRAAFADLIRDGVIDTKLPLIGDYCGAGVNLAVKAVDGGRVSFFAPAFTDIKYRLAKPVADYAREFADRIGQFKGAPVFSCNCILNYLYGGLEGKMAGDFFGPITFGEIAYQLLNQTLAYVMVI